jgi:hypothetical protein
VQQFGGFDLAKSDLPAEVLAVRVS